MKILENGVERDATQAEIAQYEAHKAAYLADTRQHALDAISVLESQVTQRRLREAALTDEGKAWLQNIEDQIAAERARVR